MLPVEPSDRRGLRDMQNVVPIYQYLTEGSVQNPEVRIAFRKNGIVKVGKTSSLLADSPAVYAIGQLFILLVSPLLFPNIAADEAQAIKSARQRLPSDL